MLHINVGRLSSDRASLSCSIMSEDCPVRGILLIRIVVGQWPVVLKTVYYFIQFYQNFREIKSDRFSVRLVKMSVARC